MSKDRKFVSRIWREKIEKSNRKMNSGKRIGIVAAAAVVDCYTFYLLLSNGQAIDKHSFKMLINPMQKTNNNHCHEQRRADIENKKNADKRAHEQKPYREKKKNEIFRALTIVRRHEFYLILIFFVVVAVVCCRRRSHAFSFVV